MQPSRGVIITPIIFTPCLFWLAPCPLSAHRISLGLRIGTIRDSILKRCGWGGVVGIPPWLKEAAHAHLCGG